MQVVKLTPRTTKAKNRIREAAAVLDGWDKKTWTVQTRKHQVSFSDVPGPWIHIFPQSAMGWNQERFSRWVNLRGDDHFTVCQETDDGLGPNVLVNRTVAVGWYLG